MSHESPVINPTPQPVMMPMRIHDASDRARRNMTKKPVMAIQNPISVTAAMKPASHVR